MAEKGKRKKPSLGEQVPRQRDHWVKSYKEERAPGESQVEETEHSKKVTEKSD